LHPNGLGMVSCGLINKIKLIKMQKDLKYFRILDEQLKFVKMTMMQRKDINDALGMIEKQLTIPVVVKSFTAEQVLEELEGEENIYDARKYFKSLL
jgi:D-arabinose 1-dehydrogenase-like Zn-dependent alcohol dehydrogenase